MYERLLKLRAAIYAVIHDKPPVSKGLTQLELKDNEWKLKESLLPVMVPLVSATEILSTEDYPNM